MSEVVNSNLSLREALNTVSLEGVLKEMALEERTSARGEYISGYVIIKTGPNSEHRVDSFANRYTKNNEESKSFLNLKSAIDNFRSIASLMKNGMTAADAEANATKVHVSGASLRLSEYYSRDGALVSEPRINSNFLSMVRDESVFKMAEPSFNMEIYVESIRPEFKAGTDEETGRLILNAYVPSFGGRIMPMTFTTTKEAGAYIGSHYEPYRTTRIFGQIVNTVMTTETRVAGFLGDEVNTTTTRVRELLITNGDPEMYDEEDVKAYKKEAIQAAMAVRVNEYLPELRRKQEERAKNAVSGNNVHASFNGGATPAAPTANGFQFTV